MGHTIDCRSCSEACPSLIICSCETLLLGRGIEAEYIYDLYILLELSYL